MLASKEKISLHIVEYYPARRMDNLQPYIRIEFTAIVQIVTGTKVHTPFHS